MKGIKLCGECANYDWKKHKCKIGCNDDSNAQAPFYGDCPLPDVVPRSEEDAECPACHGTGRIKTSDWLIKHLSKKRLAEEKAKANAEYEQHIKAEVAREIFAELDSFVKLLCTDNDDMLIYSEIRKKYLEGSEKNDTE